MWTKYVAVRRFVGGRRRFRTHMGPNVKGQAFKELLFSTLLIVLLPQSRVELERKQYTKRHSTIGFARVSLRGQKRSPTD